MNIYAYGHWNTDRTRFILDRDHAHHTATKRGMEDWAFHEIDLSKVAFPPGTTDEDKDEIIAQFLDPMMMSWKPG